MRAGEIRYAIDSLETLPIVPAVAYKALSTLSRAAFDIKELSRLISLDPSFTTLLMRPYPSGDDAPRDALVAIEEILSKFDTDVLRDRILHIIVSSLADRGWVRTFPLKAYWRHSLRAGVYAEHIASHTQSAVQREAFLAGLLHDIGKMALLVTDPDRYRTVRDTAQRERLDILEAERRILALDHTLAGKWLAERWRLPDVITKVIWLHHHAAGSLDQTHYPVALIDVTAAASMLAGNQMAGAYERRTALAHANQRLKRLGITGDEIRTLSAEVEQAVRAREQWFEDSLNEETDYPDILRKVTQELLTSHRRLSTQNARLKRQALRFSILHEMNARIFPGQSLDDLLAVLATGLRKAFRIAPGMCMVWDRKGRILHGALWRALEGIPRRLFLQLDEDRSSETEDSEDWLIPTLSNQLVLEKPDGDETAATLDDLLRRPGLIVVPLLAHGTHVGHVLFDADAPDLSLTEQDYSAFAAFAEAAAKATERHCAERQWRNELEDVVEALGYPEQPQQQPLVRAAGVEAMARAEPHRHVKDESTVECPTVLVADDNMALRDVLTEALRNYGYQVQTAANGEEAMGIIAGNRLDLVLLDLEMPVRDGWSVLTEIRDRYGSLPVIMMAGGASQEDIDEAVKRGACACLSKPFQIRRLLTELEKIFGPHGA